MEVVVEDGNPEEVDMEVAAVDGYLQEEVAVMEVVAGNLEEVEDGFLLEEVVATEVAAAGNQAEVAAMEAAAALEVEAP